MVTDLTAGYRGADHLPGQGNQLPLPINELAEYGQERFDDLACLRQVPKVGYRYRDLVVGLLPPIGVGRQISS